MTTFYVNYCEGELDTLKLFFNEEHEILERYQTYKQRGLEYNFELGVTTSTLDYPPRTH